MMTMTATTYVINKSLIENIKSDALKLAELYEDNIKIEININKVNAIVKLSVTEYNL